jgi:molybdopterin converting factor small subunit
VRLNVQLFAVARQRAGASSVPLELPDGSTVRDLKAALGRACPALAPIVSSFWIALDGNYAQDEDPVPEGAEAAAIPPVSGGQDRPVVIRATQPPTEPPDDDRADRRPD